MREQDPKIRKNNFDEVPLGYTEEEAVAEALRCLECKHKPCVGGCPAEVDIPVFIREIKEKRFAEAISVIKRTNSLPAMCGRVCPQEDQCEKYCVLQAKNDPIDIGGLERFAADWERKNLGCSGKTCGSVPDPSAGKVAIIGSGPAGLACASDLAEKGYNITIFEALHEPGGVLIYGVPEFRLPKEIVAAEVDCISKKGVEIKCNYVIGKIKTIEDLRKDGYKSFFIASGAGLPYFMGIEGENLNGVYSANEFLTRVNLMKGYRFPEYDTPVSIGNKTAVIGAGNVAMDTARCAVRLGAQEVCIIYRRTEEEMPARIDEIKHAKEEGIKFNILTSPLKLLGDESGNVRKMVCIENTLGEPDSSGRRRPVPMPGSEFEIEVDTVIVAIGNQPNPILIKTIDGLKLGKWNNIETDENGRTNIEDIFAGGDVVTGASTVIAAMGAGKKSARAIDEYLKNKS